MYDSEGTRFVGIGAQFDVTIGGYEVGVEVIVYWDPTICNGGEPVVAVYVYEGANVDMNDLKNNADYKKVVAKLTHAVSTNAADSKLTKAGLVSLYYALFADMEISVSLVGIWGYRNFKSTEDYNGTFKSLSGSLKGIKATFSYCDKCWAVCVGITSKFSGISGSISKTEYVEIYNSREGMK